MSTPLHVLLKADPRLEGDVEADRFVCLQLNRISVLKYFFFKWLALWTTNICLDRLYFFV